MGGFREGLGQTEKAAGTSGVGSGYSVSLFLGSSREGGGSVVAAEEVRLLVGFPSDMSSSSFSALTLSFPPL